MLIPQEPNQTISHCELTVIMNFVICKEKKFLTKTEKRKEIVYDSFPLEVHLKILNEL